MTTTGTPTSAEPTASGRPERDGSRADRVDALRAHLDGRWAAVRQQARQLADDPRFRPVTSTDTETLRASAWDQLQALADAGHPRRLFPTAVGGEDDLGGAITAFEMLAMGDLSLLVKAGQRQAHHVGEVSLVMTLGAQVQHCPTEQAPLVRDADGRPVPGVTITDDGLKAGLNGVDNGRLRFDQVRVPRENLLNRYGDVAADGTYTTPVENQTARFFTMLGTLIQGRISVAGGAASATKVALTIAVRYGSVRRQFAAPGGDREVPLLDYLVHQRRLLIPLAKTYALHFAQSELVAELHDVFAGAEPGDDRRRGLESRAAGTKALSTWHATETIQTCREACGGQGYLAENRLPGLKADTDVFTTFEGDNTVLLQLVGKELLAGVASQFGDLSPLGRAGFVADQAREIALERTGARSVLLRLLAARPGTDDDGELRDRDWQIGMLAWREKHMTDGVGRRLRRATSADPDGQFAIFNAAQDHLVATARAHVERVVLECFARGVEGCQDAATRRLLSMVCDLFALSTIEADRGWFVEHGRLTGSRSKAITSAVNDLVGQLRPQALVLTDAFGVPESAVDAPIASGAEAARQTEALAYAAGRPDGDDQGTSLATEEHEAVTG